MKSGSYALAIGSLMYAMVTTLRDIAHVVEVVDRFMQHNLGRLHWSTVKYVFIYLVDTQDLGILFGMDKNLGIDSYTDSNLPCCVGCRKSTTEYFCKFGNGAISWKSKL